MGKDKGKGKASTSNPSERSKRARGNEPIRTPRPVWKGGSLSSMPEEWRTELFLEKMNSLGGNKSKAFICEKEVVDPSFELFGVNKRFRDLGWEAALKCYNRGEKKLYTEEIEEWVSTLRVGPHNHPYQMSLIGQCSGHEVTMSFDTLNQIALFDTKDSAKKYFYPTYGDLYEDSDKHPRWAEMVETVFKPGKGVSPYKKCNLKIEARLLLTICLNNVTPRRGDLGEIRQWEIPILYTLLKGKPLLSYRYLVMNNIWNCRESVSRKIIPHCRLIMALLRPYIREEAVGETKKFKPFDIKNLGAGWAHVETETHHELRANGERWRVSKFGNNEDTDDDDDDEDNDDDDDDQGGDYTTAEIGGSGARSGPQHYGGYSSFGYQPHPESQNWAYQGSVDEVIAGRRPETYNNWSNENQAMYDNQSYFAVNQERANKERHDRLESWHRADAYAREQETNFRYLDDRNRQMREQWIAGDPVTPNLPYVDYSTLPPYDGTGYHPVPHLHHSMWVDPMQPPQSSSSTREGSSSSGGAYDFSQFSEFMTSIFGHQKPPYN